MSFTAPFTTTYTKGDLFYGFSLPRSDLMRSLKVSPSERGLDDLAVINNYMVTGEENQSIGTKLPLALSAKRDSMENAIFAPILAEMGIKSWKEKAPIVELLKERLKVGLDEAERLYALQLMKPHNDFVETLRAYKGGKYVNAINFQIDTAKDKDSELARQNSAWRKKCKGGLYHCIFELQKTVHFCLGASEKVDGKFVELDHNQVTTKTDPYDRESKPDTNVEKMRVITPAELRWIYRNREASEVKARVQFWVPTDNGWETCGAPWIAGNQKVKSSWASYKPKSSIAHEKVDD